MDFSRVLNDSTPYLLEGLKMTLVVSIVSIILGIVLGFLACLLGRSRFRVLRGINAVYIWIIRGTPMMVQALLIYFGLPQLVQLAVPGFRMTAFAASLITLTLNAGAYLSEIFRGGIAAVNKGQIEAARSLGLSQSKTMLKVVLPQALKIALPSMVNQFIITVKDTSILSVIGLADIVNKAKVYVGSSYQYFATYIFVAIYYLVIISILMLVLKYVEKKFNYEQKGNR